MHECPACGEVCYCDLDDSNDFRDDGECFHRCPTDADDLEYGFEDDDDDARDPSTGGGT